MDKWQITSKKILNKTHVFDLEELHFKRTNNRDSHPYYRIICADWVNILALTKSKQAILVQQMRAGVMLETLEVPGGAVDPQEKNTPDIAALRELEEETGYVSENLMSLGSMYPNPALQTNKIHFFLAQDCKLSANRKRFPDSEEELEIVLYDYEEMIKMISQGKITHALSALCILRAKTFIKSTLS